ncbi:hypothetical protein HQ531_11015 [bacterium]|nr:hypothetical protein [bacterium]
MNSKAWLSVLLHAFVGWVLCAATMGLGMAFIAIEKALIIHLIAAPIFFTIVSRNYFIRLNHFPPLQTASIFISFVMLVDFFLVALLINKSLDMFSSLTGTWIPFILIFASSYLTGLYWQNKPRNTH